MSGVWTWLKDEGNRKVMGWLIAGLGTVALYFGYFKPDEKKAPVVAAPQSQTAVSQGGNAVNASGSAQATIGNPSAAQSATQPSANVPLIPTPAASAALPSAGAQNASAAGGNAVNASGNAQVNIKP